MNCNKEFKTEKDEDWSKVPVSQHFFKCAKLKTAYSESFLVIKKTLILIRLLRFLTKIKTWFQITTVGLEFNIRLKVELKSDNIVDPLTEVLIILLSTYTFF